MTYTIAVPSYKRAENCKTAKLLKNAVIFVHEFEVKEYKKYNENKIVSIPDELGGKGMALIRNYILDNTKNDNVIMIDDDLNRLGLFEGGKQVVLTEEDIYQLIEKGFRMTKELGTVLWGVNLQSDMKFYREYTPISLSSVILGPFFGVIKDPALRFDNALGLKEDYDYSIQVLNKYRKILRLNKYHYMSDHIKAKGGCATYRTSDKEKEQAVSFQKKWGSRVVQVQRKTQGGNTSINPVVRVPIAGV